jgi:hypothetical protein
MTQAQREPALSVHGNGKSRGDQQERTDEDPAHSASAKTAGVLNASTLPTPQAGTLPPAAPRDGEGLPGADEYLIWLSPIARTEQDWRPERF